ncbi:hypothetical protein [Paractinoplanes rishiriensis]|uniref:hypothetical protein n=1 Tax=Paractinoplanes rishiriensis TaxID=1050105 RepID=UPI001945576E|nr:hypothetical protein [Actinoplanes rishiriensis]
MRVEAYQSYPCKEGHDGEGINAGKEFTISTPLTVEQLQSVGVEMLDEKEWVEVTRLASAAPGSGGDSAICYHSKKSDQNLFLQLVSGTTPNESNVPPPPFLLVELTRVDTNSRMCEY